MGVAYLQNGYGPITVSGGINYPHLGNNTWMTSYDASEMGSKIGEPGTISKLSVKITSTSTVTSTSQIDSWINGSAGTLSITIASGLTGTFSDFTHSDTVTTGDVIALRTTGTFEFGTSYTMGAAVVQFAATNTSNTASRFMADAWFGGVVISDSSSHYLNIMGQIDAMDSANTNRRACIPIACTAKYEYIQVRNNSLDAACEAVLQNNGSDTAITLSITAATTGWFQNIASTAALVANDKVGWRFRSSGMTTGSIQIVKASIDLITTTGKWISGLGQQTRSVAAGTYTLLLAGLNQSGTQDETTIEANVQGECDGLCIHIYSNSGVTNSTLRWRKNNADGNNLVTITALTTGYFDSALTDTFNVGDSCNLLLTSTGLGYTSVMWVGQIQSAPATGAIVVNKVTVPSGVDTTFSFTASTTLTTAVFTLSDGQSRIFSSVTPGSGYAVVEATKAGYSTTYTVSNSTHSTQYTNMSVSSAETVILTVTNRRLAANSSGIYKVVPQKRQDTLWTDVNTNTTVDTKIPDPVIVTAFIGD